VLDVPGSLAELTPEYMSRALSRAFPGASVERIELGEVADGTNRRARIRLWYGSGAGPSSVFVKIHGRILHRLALVALRAWRAEALLADSGVELLIEHPEFYAAATNPARIACIVIMEDVTARQGRPNDATTALSVDEVADGLAGLAKLHAAFWEQPLPGPLRFLAPWRLGRTWAPISRASLAHGLHRLTRAGRDHLVPSHITAGSLEKQFRASAVLARSGPQTVLHGDPHPGNTYGLPGDRTGFYDWQLVRRGDWGNDVGYFLAGSLEVADRRAHERELLAGYLDAARSAGASPPNFEQAWQRYQSTPAFGLATWMHTYSAGSFQPDDVSLATIERFSAAYEDLETHRSIVAG
jgi:sulfur transfer complex TusBCD TusB component (DsrH family)